MTVREIARQAGVSAATVSRYFTGTEKVSEDVRCKIQSVLGDDVSSGKRSRHKNRLMVMIVPHMRLAFYQELMKRFMEKVSPYGIQLIFLPIFNSDAAQVRALLKRLRPDGLVILEEPVTVPILDIAYEMKIPVVVWDCSGNCDRHLLWPESPFLFQQYSVFRKRNAPYPDQ